MTELQLIIGFIMWALITFILTILFLECLKRIFPDK